MKLTIALLSILIVASLLTPKFNFVSEPVYARLKADRLDPKLWWNSKHRK